MVDSWPGHPLPSRQSGSGHNNAHPTNTSSFVHVNSPHNTHTPLPQASLASRTARYSPSTDSAGESRPVRKGEIHHDKESKGDQVGSTAQSEDQHEDEWESDVEEPSNLHDVDAGPPQAPSAAHVYADPPQGPGGMEAMHEYISEPGMGLAVGDQPPQKLRTAIQSAYGRARSFVPRLRGPVYFGKPKGQKRDEDGLEECASNPETVVSTGDYENANEVNEPYMSPDRAGTPAYNNYDNNNRGRPYRRDILGALFRLHQNAGGYHHRPGLRRNNPHNRFPSPAASIRSSGRETARAKRKWWERPKNQHRSSSWSVGTIGSDTTLNSTQTGMKRSRSSGVLASAVRRLRNRSPLEEEIRATVHIAETTARQRYLEKLCEALMTYGAPTHRLEECMRMTSKVLDIDSQFLYLPGCMFVSFDDPTTHMTDLRMRRYEQGVDLGRLEDVHQIYKEVLHDRIGVEEALQDLEEVMARKPRYNIFLLILFFGLGGAAVGPFAFTARAIDLPISFVLGCLLGVLKYLAVPRSRLYANIFELTAAMVTSFLARAFGSIPYKGERLFCFPALAQSSIALILPGFMVLCSSLELQSQNVLAGSIRLVYAIIYSLVLGFGIMLGTAFYGRMDPDASSAYTCPVNPDKNIYAHSFPSVIGFTISLGLINQAKLTQLPAMVTVSFTGYIVNFFSARVFASNTQIANAMGAFVIGIMGNLYSRVGRGLAAAAMLPAILVQVPSGIAASDALVSGLAFANELTRNTAATKVLNDTSREFVNAANSTTMSGLGHDLANRIGSNKVYGDIVFDLAYAMVQVSISTTVGLFLAALVIYPEGKRRSEIFSF